MTEHHKDSIFNYADQDTAGDSSDGTYVPPDEPMGSHSFGTTRREERSGENFYERDKHTLPEVDSIHEPEEEVARLIEGDSDTPSLYDGEPAAVALEVEDDNDISEFSAEESAMHITEDPEYRERDSYY